MNKSRIYLIDDNPVVLESLTKLINRESDLSVVGFSTSGFAGAADIHRLAPDLAVVDIGLQDINGLDLIRILKAENARLKVLILSMLDELTYGEKAIERGADGYLMKQMAVNEVIRAIRCLLAGKPFVSDHLMRHLNFSHTNGGSHEPRNVDAR